MRYKLENLLVALSIIYDQLRFLIKNLIVSLMSLCHLPEKSNEKKIISIDTDTYLIAKLIANSCYVRVIFHAYVKA